LSNETYGLWIKCCIDIFKYQLVPGVILLFFEFLKFSCDKIHEEYFNETRGGFLLELLKQFAIWPLKVLHPLAFQSKTTNVLAYASQLLSKHLPDAFSCI